MSSVHQEVNMLIRMKNNIPIQSPGEGIIKCELMRSRVPTPHHIPLCLQAGAVLTVEQLAQRIFGKDAELDEDKISEIRARLEKFVAAYPQFKEVKHEINRDIRHDV